MLEQKLKTGGVTKNHSPGIGVIWCAHINSSTPISHSQQCGQLCGKLPLLPLPPTKSGWASPAPWHEEQHRGRKNQLVFVSHCVKHRKVMQTESCCRGLGFLACPGNLWKAIKIQQQAVNRCSLRWLWQLVCSHLASCTPFPASSPILDKSLMLSSLHSLKTSSSLQTQGQRKDQQ